MTKRLLINVDAAERRIAIVDGDRLENLILESASDVANRGNIFKGIVKRVEPSLQAAFVDYGAGRDGFLPLDEIQPGLVPAGVDKRAPIQKILRNKQPLLVQVTKDEVGSKGAALSTYISLAGRFLVLMPESDRTGISRKLSDEERRRLKEVLKDVELPKGFGVIARTAARALTKGDAVKDLSYLTRLWNGIDRRFEEMRWPGLIYEESNLAIRFVRDYFSNEIEEIWVDDHEVFQEVHDFVSVLMPKHQQKVRLYADEEPLFTKFGVEDQIDHVFTRQVPLPSGGSIVIDETEALVAIDVNSGKTKEKNIEDTAFQTNLEAADEIARQCMLRDLGGLVVLDFIDMKESARKKKVEAALKKAFKNDKARTRFGRISSFGMMEMSRQRLRTSVRSRTFLTCPHCEGTGKVRSDESAAVRVLRQLRSITATSRVGYVRAELPPNLAHYLLNHRRRELSAIEREARVRIEIFDEPTIVSNNVRFELHEVEPRTEPLTKEPVAHLHGADPAKAETPTTPRERRGGDARSKALSMYHPDLIDREAAAAHVAELEPEDVVEEVATPEAAPPAGTVAPPPPAHEPPPLPADPTVQSPIPLSTPSTQRWSGSLESRPVFAEAPQPHTRWGGAPSESEETSRPLRWLRRLFGGPEPPPAATPHVPRPRTIVVPEPPEDLEDGAAEALAPAAAAPSPARAPERPSGERAAAAATVAAPAAAAAGDRTREQESRAAGEARARAEEAEKAEEARKRRRRGGRGRRKNGDAAAASEPGGAPERAAAGARAAAKPSGPAEGGAQAAEGEKKSARRRRPRRSGGVEREPQATNAGSGAKPAEGPGAPPEGDGGAGRGEDGQKSAASRRRRRRPRRAGEAGARDAGGDAGGEG